MQKRRKTFPCVRVLRGCLYQSAYSQAKRLSCFTKIFPRPKKIIELTLRSSYSQTKSVLLSNIILGVCSSPMAKLSIATGQAMQIYNCLGQLRQLKICIS